MINEPAQNDVVLLGRWNGWSDGIGRGTGGIGLGWVGMGWMGWRVSRRGWGWCIFGIALRKGFSTLCIRM